MAKAQRHSFDQLLAMMRSRDGATAEDGFHLLRRKAADYLPQLLTAYASEDQLPMQCWLLELIGEARSEAALDLLYREASSQEEALKDWAIRGLKMLDTKAARTFLFEQGHSS